MSNFIELKCTNCGGELVQNPQDNTYGCKMCSAKYMLKFEHGGIQIERILDSKLEGVQAGVNVLASEMAIQRLREEVRSLREKVTQRDERIREYDQKIQELENDTNSLNFRIRNFRVGSIDYPPNPKYSFVKPIIVIASLLIGSAVLVLASGSTFASFCALQFLTALPILYYAVRIVVIYRARMTFRKQQDQMLSTEFEDLSKELRTLKTRREELKKQTSPLRKEGSEKQKELEWHLQNVKMKRE